VNIDTETITRTAKRLFGVVLILIGIALMWNLIAATPDLISNAQTRRDITGPLAMAVCGLFLLAGGAVLIWRPDWTKGM